MCAAWMLNCSRRGPYTSSRNLRTPARSMSHADCAAAQ
jgi:hypothetical protein